MTAFAIACSNQPSPQEEEKNQYTLKVIYEKNPDIHHRDNFGREPIHHAVKSGNKNTIAILIKLFGGEIGALDAKTIGGITPLMIAAS